MESRPKRKHNPKKHFRYPTPEVLDSLRNELSEAFQFSTGKEFVVLTSKNNYYYETLKYEIWEVTHISLSEGTLLTFYTINTDKPAFQVNTLMAIEKYIEEIAKRRSKEGKTEGETEKKENSDFQKLIKTTTL